MLARQNIVSIGFFLILMLVSAATRDVASAQERWPPWQSYSEAEDAARKKALRKRPSGNAEMLNKQIGQLKAAGKYPQAIALAKQSLALAERKGADSSDVASALDVLAGLYEAQNKYAEAEPLLKRALAIREKAPGQPDAEPTRARLATAYDRMGRSADAEAVRGVNKHEYVRAGHEKRADEAEQAAKVEEQRRAAAVSGEVARTAAGQAAKAEEQRRAEAEEERRAEAARTEAARTEDWAAAQRSQRGNESYMQRRSQAPSGGAAVPPPPAAEPRVTIERDGDHDLKPGAAAPEDGEDTPSLGAAPPPPPAEAQGAPSPAPLAAAPPPPPPPAPEPQVGAAPPPVADGASQRSAKRRSAVRGPESAPSPPAAAAAPSPSGGGAAAPAAEPDWQVVPVYWGTDRAVQPNAQRLVFGSDRARKLQVGEALITVPKVHQVPKVERPWVVTIPYFDLTIYAEKEDAKQHFTVKEIKALSKEELLAQVRSRLAESKAFKDQALVFVHGYNTSFDNALYRTAQIAYDLGFDGAPFVYSWPSGGAVASYTYDRESAQASEPYLRQFLEMVVKQTGAKQVSIIAHSMGNQPLLDVLREMRSSAPEGVEISQVILAAPDVDADSFSNLATAIKGLAKNVTLYVASNDRALIVSRNFWGNYRAGDVPPAGPLILPGIDTIDVTAASTDAFAINHSGYAQNNQLLKDIGELLTTGLRPPEMRIMRPSKVTTQAGDYWRYIPLPPGPPATTATP